MRDLRGACRKQAASPNYAEGRIACLVWARIAQLHCQRHDAWGHHNREEDESCQKIMHAKLLEKVANLIRWPTFLLSAKGCAQIIYNLQLPENLFHCGTGIAPGTG